MQGIEGVVKFGRYDNATKLFFSDKNNFLSVIKLYFEKDVVHEHDDATTGRLFSLAGYMDDLNRGEMKRATMYGRERDAL